MGGRFGRCNVEQEFLDWLRENLPASPLLRVGMGDDAAVLPWSAGGDLVVTTDAITDGVDFHLAETVPEQIGHKALAVNLSDLAAMAAEPVAAVVSLVLPRAGALELAIALYQGMLPLAEQLGVAIAGGDTNTWQGPLAISVTALGRTTGRGPLTRRGARVGDALLVTGAFGGSLLGRHLAVQPRVREAIALHQRYDLHAGMDVSDGLALDGARLAAASGCGLALDLQAIPISADAYGMAGATGRTPLAHALGDGEDFELLIAAPPEAAEAIVRDQPLEAPVTCIGRFVPEPGLWQTTGQGRLEPLAATGYEH
ncbi:MAG TPA: thiamine-phosphate kinase [Lacipirellulaceae bacterium]|nr:thiamine-phosphate kinase [Lacipirellulaceae bacterium]